jgi:ribosomal protein L24E
MLYQCPICDRVFEQRGDGWQGHKFISQEEIVAKRLQGNVYYNKRTTNVCDRKCWETYNKRRLARRIHWVERFKSARVAKETVSADTKES